jgi:hypothetical protein
MENLNHKALVFWRAHPLPHCFACFVIDHNVSDRL